MIKGIGIDLIEFTRFSEVAEDFFSQVFTAAELQTVKKNPLLAGLRFSIKEAVLKALGTGLYFGFFFKNVELKNNSKVIITEPLKKSLSDKRYCINIGTGNSKKYACAIAIIEERQEVD